MKREMKHEIRKSEEFINAICAVYNNKLSCANVAKRISKQYGFHVSGEYVSRVLHERNIRVRGNGRKTYSIYDTQLGISRD